MNDARTRARRAILSALAGSGLTAASLLGSPGALATESANGTGAAPGGQSGAGASAPGAEKESTGTSTTTSTSTTSTATTSSPSTPSPSNGPTQSTQASTTEATTPPTITQQPPSGGSTSQASGPQILSQHDQRGTSGGPVVSAPPSQKPAKQPSKAAATSQLAPAPQIAAALSGVIAPAMPGTLAASLAASNVSAQALGFYQIPLFLLPIYQAAAVQYGVPWQVLAAINEVETDYGTDLSVSTAGAVGWMQFMPETWLQYGVDAVNAGYADPYNPVDAIFAAARYLRAAGAQSNLNGAIFAYNHSEAYVESVLLRARLIASYPASVIATLTGLTEGTPPVANAQLVSDATPSGEQTPGGASSATAGAAPAQPTGDLPGSTPAPPPSASAASVSGALDSAAPSSQLSRLSGASGAPVVAVEDGRIVGIGSSRKLGDYVVLRDTYGDVFTYAGLGSIAPFFRDAKPSQVSVQKGALSEGGTGVTPAPTAPATAGSQPAVTVHVAKRGSGSAGGQAGAASGSSGAASSEPPAPVGIGKVRVFAHPGNPDELAAIAAKAAEARAAAVDKGWGVLRRGSLVTQGTVLGWLSSSGESESSYLSFAIRPSGDQSAIDPAPILQNWKDLSAALRPKGAQAGAVLAGATASDAFHLPIAELERAVLSDPGIVLSACDRSQIAAGKVEGRALAILVFLSRSGLKPTVGRLRCGRTAYTAGGPVTGLYAGTALDITAVNGIPIAGHQGAGTITDVTIRTLLTIPGKFAPERIVSLMSYPNAPSTVAQSEHGEYIELDLPPRGRARASQATAHASSTGAQRRESFDAPLSTAQWQTLMKRIAAIPQPKVSRTPSSAAIRLSSSGR